MFVTHQSSDFVIVVIYFSEELSVSLVVLTSSEETDGYVVCKIIDSVDEGVMS